MKKWIHYRLSWKILAAFLFVPVVSKASFIEATMGTAVVNDATATYFNPAALTLLKNAQIIALGTAGQFQSQFTGKVTQPSTGFDQSGTTKTQSNYFLPSGYLGIPVSDRWFFGLAVLANNYNRDLDQNSILRYVMSDNNIEDIDVVPAVGFKLNDYLSFGASVNFSHAHFLFTPISGFPSLDIPDVQTRDEASANALGGDLGVLLKPTSSTQIGLNYRSSMTYHFTGTSQLESNPAIASNHFGFDYWTPARYVLSVNQFLSRRLGLIATVQWIQWDIYNNINVHNVVTEIGGNPVILSNATIPLHFHNAWVYTFGGYYHLSSKWIIRTAGSYVESPGNPNYQVTEGNNMILGTSVGYKLSKIFSIDTSYAHAFIQNQKINIENSINTVNGVNKSYRNSISLKITANI
ncbi:MAG TPA: outer membrane protein transport protein [Gammaproteobacteria bacterium]|nr:outer membrane protein transport protein [Gammaproteobacteria bacterium]